MAVEAKSQAWWDAMPKDWKAGIASSMNGNVGVGHLLDQATLDERVRVFFVPILIADQVESAIVALLQPPSR